MTTHRLLWIPGVLSILLALSAAASAQTPTPAPPPLFTEAPGSPFPVGTDPDSVAVGDFNGDGKPDLAIANRNSDNVTVLLGNGKGGFTAAPGSPFTVGKYPDSVAAGDFNGDSKPDLAIANRNSDNVTVLLGNGKGGFTAAPGSPFTVARGGPGSTAVGDFNGDGKPDLAFADLHIASGFERMLQGTETMLQGTVAVLLGNGTGGFTPAPGSPFTVGLEPRSVAVGDFNGDGKPDLAIPGFHPDVDNPNGTVEVLLGTGTSGFTVVPGSPFTVGSHPWSVAVGDFNGDSKPDLAIANGGSDNVTVLLSDGTGGFTPAPGSPFTVGSGPSSVAVGDFNGDGKRDLAIANGKDNTVTVLLSNGRGGFTAAPGSPFPAGAHPYSVAVGDFNRDGKPDLAIASSESAAVTVLLNTYSGSATPTPAKPRLKRLAPGR